MVQNMSYYIIPVTVLVLPSIVAVVAIVRYWVQNHNKEQTDV